MQIFAFENRKEGNSMKLISIKLLCIMLLCLLVVSGCGASNESKTPASSTENSSSTMTIAASFYPMYIFALNIAKDIPNVNVIDMTKPTAGDLHDYAVTPDDMKNLELSLIHISEPTRLGMISYAVFCLKKKKKKKKKK